MTIQEIFNNLSDQCERSKNAIELVNKSEYLANQETKCIQDLVIRQAFVSVFTEWEHFLENSTIAFALGETTLSGHTLTKYISPYSEDHADRLIRGTGKYPDWSQIRIVKELEAALFKDGEPFKSALSGFSSKYKEMQKIRNVIVHNSVKSRGEYDDVVRTVLGPAQVGITPANFLISKKGSAPLFYDMYITYIINAASYIVNYSPNLENDNDITEA